MTLPLLFEVLVVLHSSSRQVRYSTLTAFFKILFTLSFISHQCYVVLTWCHCKINHKIILLPKSLSPTWSLSPFPEVCVLLCMNFHYAVICPVYLIHVDPITVTLFGEKYKLLSFSCMFSILLLTLSLVQISYQHSAFRHLKSVFVPKEKYVMNFKLPSKIDFVCGYLNTSL
jgi:hypothetical protein